jgi:hypothetical protein
MMTYKNTWGAPSADSIDQQRSDLWEVHINLPQAVVAAIGNVANNVNTGGQPNSSQTGSLGGASTWDTYVRWAVEKFPFPTREREVIPIKYLQQTNFQVGGDANSGPIEMTVRYAFNQRTAELLERWFWLTSNPITGGVALSSQIKSDGYFYWLVPDITAMTQAPSTNQIQGNDSNIFDQIPAFYLEGCMITDFKPSDQDQTVGNAVTSFALKMQIDRYYPMDPSDLTYKLAVQTT